MPTIDKESYTFLACLWKGLRFSGYGPTPRTARRPAGPVVGVEPTRQARARNDANDPNVWCGRALQEVFVDLSVRSCINVSGLILEHLLRATIDISAHTFSLPARPQLGHLGHQGSHAPGRPVLHLISSSRRPLRETGCEATSSLAPYRCSSFVRAMRPFLRPGVRLTSGAARRGRQGWPSRLARLGRRRFQATP